MSILSGQKCAGSISKLDAESTPRADVKAIENTDTSTIQNYLNAFILNHHICAGSVSNLGVVKLLLISTGSMLLHAKSTG